MINKLFYGNTIYLFIHLFTFYDSYTLYYNLQSLNITDISFLSPANNLHNCLLQKESGEGNAGYQRQPRIGINNRRAAVVAVSAAVGSLFTAAKNDQFNLNRQLNIAILTFW